MFPRVETILNTEGCTTKVAEGLFGSIQKACTKIGDSCKNPCQAIKTSKVTARNDIERQVLQEQKNSIVHESTMLYTLNALGKSDSTGEINAHVQRFIYSIAEPMKPSLVNEYVEGITLGDPQLFKLFPESLTLLPQLQVQVLFVLHSIRRLLPNFTHGDLHANNIFITQRVLHERCKFDFYFEDIHTVTFEEPQMVRLVDFGLSQSKQLRKPSLDSFQDNWKADAFTALAAFWGISSGKTRVLFETFARLVFGRYAVLLNQPDVDVSQVILSEGPMDDFLMEACQFFNIQT